MLFGRRNLCLIEMERESMRVAGRFNAQVMDHLRQFVQPGITTDEIDQLVLEYTRDHGHTPACLGYQGFPKSCCTSINEVICHGIPGNEVLKDGDIVNLDVTTIVDGWLGDQSETFLIGNVSQQARKLVQCAFDSLYLGIDAIGPGDPIVNIGRAISREAHSLDYEVVREYVGHGIGKRFHQEPSIPHFPNQQSRFQKIDPGICFTIEPMINEGVRDTVLDRDDGWTVRTRDGKLSAQFEHTILMTDEGPEILTLTETGPQCGHQF